MEIVCGDGGLGKSRRFRGRNEKAGANPRARLPRGLRTPEDAFRRPILEALVELGGRAPIGKVLERVEQKMKGVLNQYDYEPLPSDPRSPRWRNTAQWCRRAPRRGHLQYPCSRGPHAASRSEHQEERFSLRCLGDL